PVEEPSRSTDAAGTATGSCREGIESAEYAVVKKDIILLIAGILFAALYTGGVVILGYEWGHSGKVALEAKYNLQVQVDKAAAAKVVADNKLKTDDLKKQVADANAKYEAIRDAQTPSVSDSISASMSAGALKLRNTAAETCPSGSAGSAATVASRAADAAATQALADRVQTAIAVVRVGDEADKREQLLDAKITALQDVINAERAAYNAKYSQH